MRGRLPGSKARAAPGLNTGIAGRPRLLQLSGVAMSSHLIFDFDGTLADSEEVCFQLFNEMADQHGYMRLARGDLAQVKALSYVERCRRLGIPLLRVPLLANEARRRYHR